MMKTLISSMIIIIFTLLSCHGGNMKNGIPVTNGDSTNDTSGRPSASKIDSTNIQQATDTAVYKRKFSKEDSDRLKPADSLKSKKHE